MSQFVKSAIRIQLVSFILLVLLAMLFTQITVTNNHFLPATHLLSSQTKLVIDDGNQAYIIWYDGSNDIVAVPSEIKSVCVLKEHIIGNLTSGMYGNGYFVLTISNGEVVKGATYDQMIDLIKKDYSNEELNKLELEPVTNYIKDI